MKIELLERVGEGRFLWFKTSGYGQEMLCRFKCAICGREAENKHLYGDYTGPPPLYFILKYAGMMMVECGNYHPVNIEVCESHKESEIKKQVEIEVERLG